MKLVVAGVASDPNKIASKNWISCLDYLGLNYEILGSNMDYKHNGERTQLYQDFLKNSDADVVVLTDVYDIIPNKNIKNIAEGMTVEEYILDIFIGYSHDIVVGGERICSPGYCYQYNIKNVFSKEYKYPNAGMIIGYRQSLLDMFISISNYMKQGKIGRNGIRHDQYRLGYYMDKNPNKIYIETEGSLFNNNYLFIDYDTMRKRCDYAVFSHFPGMKAYSQSIKYYNILASENDLGQLDKINRSIDIVIVLVGILIFILILIFLGPYIKI